MLNETELTEGQRADLKNRFMHHTPKDGQPEKYEVMRAMGLAFATSVLSHVPDGRERALAVTKIEEAVFWANAGIARSR